jgi:capsular polysaccharide biosynthesis protein
MEKLGNEWSYDVVEFGDFTQQDQIKLVNKADILIGMTGTNTLNALFGKPGLRLIEILSERMLDFQGPTINRMGYVDHYIYRASKNETVFLPENIKWISDADFEKEYNRDEVWNEVNSFDLWHRSASVEINNTRFWESMAFVFQY